MGGPYVDLERATWFTQTTCAEEAALGFAMGGGWASCATARSRKNC